MTLTCYSDVLCVWAFIAQARLDEVARRFAGQVIIDYRFCSVFGDTPHKIGAGWAERGGFEGFARHVQEAAVGYDHVQIHPDLWQRLRPASSTPAHLVLKAVQRVVPELGEPVLHELRRAFFERCADIGRWSELRSVLEAVGVGVTEIRAVIDSGVAFADLEADQRDKALLLVQGSPTILLNDGRQKLYGNVGYGVIEANIKELLRSKTAGEASWC